MIDSEKTKEQLLAELQETRRQLEIVTGAGENDKKTGAELIKSEEMFSKAFLASPDMIIISSITEGKYIEVNDAFTRNVGYTREELIGHTLEEYSFFSSPAEQERMMVLLRKQGNFRGEEFTFRVRSGEIQQWLCSAEVISVCGENRMIAVAADITRRKKMEQALNEYEQMIGIAFRSSPQAIGIARLESGKFIEVNDSQVNSFGYTREELIGHSAVELNIWKTREDSERIVRQLKKTGRVSNEEVLFRNKSGQLQPTLFSAEVIKIRGELCVIASSTDLTDRWEMERALRESEEKFSKAFSSSPTSVCLFNTEDSKFIEINDSFVRFTGYDHNEIIGHTPDELNLWVSREEMDKMATTLKTTGKLNNERIQSRMKTGEVRTGLFSAQTFQMNGKPLMILSINDITDQTKAEDAIANEAILRRVLIQNSRDGIVILDDNGKVFEANRQYCEMLGYTPEEIKDLHVWDWENTINREKLMEMIHTVDDTGDHFETQHRRKDGSIYDVEICTNGAVISGKKLVFCICRDITERKHIEKALRESEEIFSKVFHSGPEVTAITTIKEGRYIDINENYSQHMGFSREELVGHTAGELGIWVDIQERMDMFETIKKYGKVSKKEYRFRTKSGDIRTWLFSAEPITIGNEPCLLGISIDITDQKLIEAKAQEAENLQEVERLRRELLSNVSHELRTPLASIKGFTSMLLDYGKRLKPSEKREYLETIDKNADRLVELIEQLLEMSRLGAGMLSIRKKPTNIISLCRSAITEARMRAVNHIFILDLPKKLPQIEIDDRRIRQVLDHVLDNAVKYSKTGTEITLSVRKTDGNMLFVIADHGSGISPEDMPHIFERMFISRQKARNTNSGAGLGLTICKGLIEAHDGKIWVESEEGVGSKCFFTLPIKPETADQKKAGQTKLP
jgi:PAS domain S-box-containing protein